IDPTVFFETLQQNSDPGLRFRIALGVSHQHANAPHAPGLLRARPERPGCRGTAQQCDVLASSYVEPGLPLVTRPLSVTRLRLPRKRRPFLRAALNRCEARGVVAGRFPPEPLISAPRRPAGAP